MRHAWAGLWLALREEQNFRLECLGTLLMLLLSWWLATPWIPMWLCCMIIMGLELLNSALETALDLLHPQPHAAVKRAKDLAAAAVLLAAMMTGVLAAYWFIPALLKKF